MFGKRLKLFRTRKGLKQRELGEMVGFMGKTSDVRIAQYETESRTPKDYLIKELAEIFGVSTRAITVPNIDSYLGLMHTLFTLEDTYGFQISSIDNKLCITLNEESDTYEQMSAMFTSWYTAAANLETGNITKDEYDDWRYNYPESDESHHFVSNPISDEMDEYLQDELSEEMKKRGLL